MTLIYAGFEQVGNPTLKHRTTDSKPIPPHHNIQIVFMGFEQMNSMLYNTVNTSPKDCKPLYKFW